MNVAGWALMTLGAGLLTVAAFGVLRLPDVYARQHASTKAATLALGTMIAGLALLHPETQWWLRLGLLLGLLAVTLPVASHALGRAAAAAERRLRDQQPDR
jgi:multicomponent Na+:H+ antiporter subunit G